jgi:hypothetical protein
MSTGTSTPRPNCKCHGEPTSWHKDPRYTLGGYWECAPKYRARSKRRYDALEGRGYLHHLLVNRRHQAARRRRMREAARG